jgi:hypothetical protein
MIKSSQERKKWTVSIANATAPAAIAKVTSFRRAIFFRMLFISLPLCKSAHAHVRRRKTKTTFSRRKQMAAPRASEAIITT